ncbi:MAG: DUF1002 domain-containing protein [Tissierellia bacterium]|nr:DUF1002 domain-containing protein [Tissierellia bacterium]
MKKYMSLLLAFMFLFNLMVFADSSVVVTIGKDISKDQRAQMLDLFKVEENKTTIIEVNNEEERQYLEGVATEDQIGNMTLSSAYVEILEEGSGIDVEIYNINWVTKEMYQSALITAGVSDAKVIAAAPFPVTGTGALTGILKAFELATGKTISEEQKKVANEEVITLGDLGEEIGPDQATELIRIVKEELVKRDLKDPEDIKKLVIDIAGKLDIKLNADNITDLSGLMENISKLNLDTEQIKSGLKDLGQKLDDTIKNNEEVQTLLQKIFAAIKEFFQSLFK